MNPVPEILYPNNGKRFHNPTEEIGTRQIYELAEYRLAGLLPSFVEAIANAKELFGPGPVWTNQAFLGTQMGRNTPRKTWKSPVAVDVTVPERNPDRSYVMLDFIPGTGFDFSLWHPSQSEFFNSVYGNYFKKLPKMIKDPYTKEAAIATNYAPGSCADYPIVMGPKLAPRFDEQGEIKWFSMDAFRKANPQVGETPHTIPPPILGISDSDLRTTISNVVENLTLSDRECMNIIRGLLGAPIPGGGTPADSI